MPLITGSASSMSDLRTALRNACVANGWTLSGDVLHKGTCYARHTIVACPAPSTRPSIGTRDYLVVSAGNGIDGSNALTTPAGNTACVGPLITYTTPATVSTTLAYMDWTFPVTYYIHINTAPDEVWLVVNYNGVYYQHMGFGQSPAPGNPGTGNWFFATLSELGYTHNNYTYKDGKEIATGTGFNFNISAFGIGYVVPQPFGVYRVNGTTGDGSGNGAVNYSFHSLNGTTGAAAWSAYGDGFGGQYQAGAVGGVNGGVAIYDIYNKQPNNWNQESVLCPVQPMKRRPSGFTSMVGDIRHLRYIRVDFLEAGAVVDHDPDFWRVYPVYLKNTVVPGGGGPLEHSGCHGVAVRYTV